MLTSAIYFSTVYCKPESRDCTQNVKHSQITKQLLTSISGNIRIYQPSKDIFTSAFALILIGNN